MNNSVTDNYYELSTWSLMSKIKVPTENDLTKIIYNEVYKEQAVKLATHIFTIKDLVFRFNYGYYLIEENASWSEIRTFESNNKLYYQTKNKPAVEIKVSHNIDTNSKYYERLATLFISNNKLYYQIKNKESIEIKIGYRIKDGINKDIYNNIIYKLQNPNFSLDQQEKNSIMQYLAAKQYLDSYKLDGEGSGGNLMVDEFKKSFNSYKEMVKSIEVTKISPLVDNFMNIMDLDLDKLEIDKYQAIHIVTKFDSTSTHVESLLTDGKFLFWINRGGDTTGSNPGIKVFKIIKDIEYVKDTLKWLQVEEKSQVETRSKIYTMLREDGDQNIPEHILIPMEPQSIGNCGWTQTKAMLKATALVGRVGNLGELPDIESQEWQKAIKDADDIYKDFVSYDIAKRLEAIIFTINSEFKPVFLASSEQDEINSRRMALENPITNELLEKIHHLFNVKADKFTNSIYEQQVAYVRELIALEVALNSDAGKALERIIDSKEEVRLELEQYQVNKAHNFEELSSIYKAIEVSRLDYAPMQDQLFKYIVNYLITINYNIDKINDFNDMVTAKIKDCLSECTTECIMTKVECHIIEETQEICLAEQPILMGIDSIYLV
jgi:hypothetical protein